MLPDSCDVDIFESAYANVGLCSDSLWMLNDSDSFQRTNQELWINYNRVKRRYNEIVSQDCISTPKVKQVRTVRDIIPFSNLARWGNYEYDDDRESLYATDDTLPIDEEHNISSETCIEPWMLPEVEEEFKRLTHKVSSQHKLWSPEVEPQTSQRRVASDGRIWASGRWWQVESWAAILLLHYPELAHALQDTKQRSLFSDDDQGVWRLPIEPQDLTLFPLPRYSAKSPEELVMQSRINSPEVRDLWAITPPPPLTRQSALYLQATPLTRRPPPPTLNAEVPEFFPKAPSVPINISVPTSIDGPCPLYFPSALGSPDELFPYRQCCPQSKLNAPPTPQNIPVYQRPPEFYTQQLEMVPGNRRQGGGVDFNNLILLTSKSQGPRRARIQLARQQSLLDWLQEVYPDRRRSMNSVDTLVEELTAYEGRLVVVDTPPANINAPVTSPSDISTPSTAMATSTPPLDTSSTSPSPLKRRLYRDVLANSSPPSPVTTPLLVTHSRWGADAAPAVAATSCSNTLEKRYEELERQALEQYRSSEESITQRFQELERQALEQYQGGNSSGSSDGEPRQCQGSEHCGAVPPSDVPPRGGPPKRAQSQHELAAGGRVRPAAASKSQCIIGPGLAAAVRPSAGRGGGDKNTAQGTAARRRLVLVSSEKRPTPTLAPPMDTSESDDGDSTDGGGPRILVVAPSSRKPCRLVAAVLDGDGGGDKSATAAVVTAHTPEANPNEQRTQVSAEPRIQSANIVKDDPHGVPETWVQLTRVTTLPTSTPTTTKPKAARELSVAGHCYDSIVETYLEPRECCGVTSTHRRRRRRRPRALKASPKMSAEELYFHTIASRRLGLVPYDFAINVCPAQGLVDYLSDTLIMYHIKPRLRRRYASWPEDAASTLWYDDVFRDWRRSSQTIYHVTAQTLRRRAAMALRRVLTDWLPTRPQGTFLVEMKTTSVRHLLTITVVEDTHSDLPFRRHSGVTSAVEEVPRCAALQQEGNTRKMPNLYYCNFESNSAGSDLCDKDFLCTFRWVSLWPNGNAFVSTVRGILRNENRLAKEAERRFAESSSRMLRLLWSKSRTGRVGQEEEFAQLRNATRSYNAGSLLPKHVADMIKHIISSKKNLVQDLINKSRNELEHNKNIGFITGSATSKGATDAVRQLLLSKYQDPKKDCQIQQYNDNNNKDYGYNTSTVLFPQAVGKCVRDAVKQFMLSKNYYMQDLKLRTQNHTRPNKENYNRDPISPSQSINRTNTDEDVVSKTNYIPNRQCEPRTYTRMHRLINDMNQGGGELTLLYMDIDFGKVVTSTHNISCKGAASSFLQTENISSYGRSRQSFSETENNKNNGVPFSFHFETSNTIYSEDMQLSPTVATISNYAETNQPVGINNNSSSKENPWMTSVDSNDNSYIKLNSFSHTISNNSGETSPSSSQIEINSIIYKKMNSTLQLVQHKICPYNKSGPSCSSLIITSGSIDKEMLNIVENAYDVSLAGDVSSPYSIMPSTSRMVSIYDMVTPPLSETDQRNNTDAKAIPSTLSIKNSNSYEHISTLSSEFESSKINYGDVYISPTEHTNGSFKAKESSLACVKCNYNNLSPSSSQVKCDANFGKTMSRATSVEDTENSDAVYPLISQNNNNRDSSLDKSLSLPEGSSHDFLSSTFVVENNKYQTVILASLQLESDSGSYKTTISSSSPIESDESSYDTMSSSGNTTPSPILVESAAEINPEEFILNNNEAADIIKQHDSGKNVESDVTKSGYGLDVNSDVRNVRSLDCDITNNKYLEATIMDPSEKTWKCCVPTNSKSNEALETKDKKEMGHMLTNIKVLKKRILKRQKKSNSVSKANDCWDSAESNDELEALRLSNIFSENKSRKRHETDHKHEMDDNEPTRRIDTTNSRMCIQINDDGTDSVEENIVQKDNSPRHQKIRPRSTCVMQ